MADYHASSKPISRSSGRSAAGAAAYRSAQRITDERTGLVHDYTRKAGVEYSEIIVPEGGGQFTRQQLWNAAEAAEKRKDARVAREWELGIPFELTAQQQRVELLRDFGAEYVKRYGCAFDASIHEPSKKGDQRNWHIHAMTTTRQVRDGQLSEKTDIELEDKKLKALEKPTGRQQIEQVRALWAACCNRALERAQSAKRVDHRSLKAQRDAAEQEAAQLARQGKEEEAKAAELKAAELDRTPQRHVGWKATAMERRDIPTERGEDRRAVQQQAQQRRGIVAELRLLWKKSKAAIRELIQKPAKSSRAGEVEKFIYAHRYEFTTRDEGERWFKERMHLLSQYNETEYTARSVFEQHSMPGDASTTIAAGMAGSNRRIEYWTQEAAKFEKQISQHRDPRSLFQRLKGEPDRDLAGLQSQREESLHHAQRQRDTLTTLEEMWQRKKPEWEQEAKQQNVKRIVNNQWRRDQWLALYDVRDDVLEALGHRDRDRDQARLREIASHPEKSGYQWATRTEFHNRAFCEPERGAQELESYLAKGTVSEPVRQAFNDGVAYAVICRARQGCLAPSRIAEVVRLSTGITGQRFNNLMNEPDPNRYAGKIRPDAPQHTRTINRGR